MAAPTPPVLPTDPKALKEIRDQAIKALEKTETVEAERLAKRLATSRAQVTKLEKLVEPQTWSRTAGKKLGGAAGWLFKPFVSGKEFAVGLMASPAKWPLIGAGVVAAAGVTYMLLPRGKEFKPEMAGGMDGLDMAERKLAMQQMALQQQMAMQAQGVNTIAGVPEVTDGAMLRRTRPDLFPAQTAGMNPGTPDVAAGAKQI